MRYLAHGITGQPAEAARDAEYVIELAVQAHDERQRLRGISNLAIALTYGPTPAAEAVDRLAAPVSRELEATARPGSSSRHGPRSCSPCACDSRKREALYEQAQKTARELGQPVLAAQLAFNAGEVELRAGDAARAESILRDAESVFMDVGDSFFLASVAAMRGQALLELGQQEEASLEAARARDLAAEDDLDAQSRWRGVQSAVLLAKGER